MTVGELIKELGKYDETLEVEFLNTEVMEQYELTQVACEAGDDLVLLVG